MKKGVMKLSACDIENRFAELFSDRLKKGATCITDEDVNAIGADFRFAPKDFEEEEEINPQGHLQAATQVILSKILRNNNPSSKVLTKAPEDYIARIMIKS